MLIESARNWFSNQGIYYVTENYDWIIKKEGEYITEELKKLGFKSRVTITHRGIFNSTVHFGSINVFYPAKGRMNLSHKSNRVVVTYYHIVPGDERVKSLNELDKFVDIWHTASTLTKRELTENGIPGEKIVTIPLGVDLDLFRPLPAEEKIELRKKIGIPENCLIIGSFQKDGVGWNDGYEPKLIKGPDIFCNVIKKLKTKYPVFVLLTGPARGYVKRKLEEIGVPYKHIYAKFSELPKFYGLLNFYLVTSRVEGLPKSVLECMATGTPFVSTRVGIVPDVVRDFENGLVCEPEDVDSIAQKAELLINDADLRNRIISNMSRDVLCYSWEKIIPQYIEKIYSKLKNA